MERAPRPGGELAVTGPLINVAQLLKQPVGAARRYQLVVETLPLDDEGVAEGLAGPLKLVRVGSGLLVTGELTGRTTLTCVRCLEEYDQALTLQLEDEFRPTIDVNTGVSTGAARAESEVNEDYFLIGADHVLDLSEALRQAVWLATPMMPRCREDCPGIAPPAAVDDEGTAAPAVVDERLAVLGHLLEAAEERPADAPPRQRGRLRRPPG